MQRQYSTGMCFLLGLAFWTFGAGELSIAGEPLPDASVLAYRGRRSHKPPAQPKISEVTLTGTITDVQSGGLTIKASKTSTSKNQKQWRVSAQSDTTSFTIHGTATPDYLRKGHVIEFSAQIVSSDKTADKPKEEKTADRVKELTIIARKGRAASKKGGTKEKGHAVDPGIAGNRVEMPKPATDLDLSSEESANSSNPTSGNAAAPAAKVASIASTTKITGRIAAISGSDLTVTCGERTIHVELSSIPTINVEISGPKVVSDSKDESRVRIEGPGASGHLVTIEGSDMVGAKIVASGTAAETKSRRQCAAKSIEVTLTKPLTGKKPISPEAKKTT